jgi:hypothetical protein
VRARDSVIALFGCIACGGSATLVGVEVTETAGSECGHLQPEDEPRDIAPRCKGIQLTVARGVDVLFVIDDGPEAGALQTRLAAAMDDLAASFATMDPEPELRIAFTSSRDFNPSCKGEGGAGRFLLSSCRERPDAFVDADGNDRFAEVCLAQCDLDEVTTSRPWIESIQHETNLAPGVAMADALRCASLLGVSGCPFPAPFNATKYAFLRSADDAEAEAGFFRPDASKILVWITSGPECSLGPTGHEAFDPDGSRALWSDPDVATAGLCWNAGIECTAPDADGLMSCEASDVGVDGMPASADVAVLHPVAELAEFLADVHDQLHDYNPVAEVRVIAITGAPADSRAGSAPTFAPTDDTTAALYGVQPTCMLGDDAMLPPVRLAALRELADAHWFAQPELFSACKDDYAPSLVHVAEAIEDASIPSCMPACVADVEPDVAGVQVDCRVTAQIPTRSPDTDQFVIDEFVMTRCVPSANGEPTIPPGEPGCIATRTGTAMHERCIDYGYNLEFVIVWDGPKPPGASFTPSCKLSRDKEADCPEL